MLSSRAQTASLVSARMQSNRRITVSGRMTSPYSCGLYTPVSLSAIAQIRFAFSLMFALSPIVVLPIPVIRCAVVSITRHAALRKRNVPFWVCHILSRAYARASPPATGFSQSPSLDSSTSWCSRCGGCATRATRGISGGGSLSPVRILSCGRAYRHTPPQE